MSARMHARLIAAAAGAALLWAGLAPPVLALGQVFVFLDPALSKRYAAMEGKMTKLQIQNAAEQLSLKLRGKKVACRGVIEDVMPPDPDSADPDACKVMVALVGVAGFTTAELPTVTYLVPKARALALKLRGPVSFSGRLYAVNRHGAVAIELDAPSGWRDPLSEASAPTAAN